MKEFSVSEIIEMAILIEQSGYAYYGQALRRKNLSFKTKELLTKLRDQEKQHEIFFNGLRKEDDFELLNFGEDQELVHDYLRAIVNYRIFSKPEAALKAAEQAKDEKALIEAAIDFEKDTLLYYQGIKEAIKDSEAKDVLGKIIKEEISHVLWLVLHRDALTD